MEDSAAISLDVPLVPITVLLELLIDVEQELFNLEASVHVLGVKARTDAEVEGLLRLFLSWTFLKARSLSSKSEFDDFSALWHILAALTNDTLHVASLGTDQTTGNLELFLIWNLDIISACVLCRVVSITLLIGIPL